MRAYPNPQPTHRERRQPQAIAVPIARSANAHVAYLIRPMMWALAAYAVAQACCWMLG